MVSQSELIYTGVVTELRQRTKNMRCSEVRSALESLGFVVDPKGTAGHRAYKHPLISDFHGGSYDCGHGNNGEIKPVYVRNILRVLESYKDEILEILKGQKNGQ